MYAGNRPFGEAVLAYTGRHRLDRVEEIPESQAAVALETLDLAFDEQTRCTGGWPPQCTVS